MKEFKEKIQHKIKLYSLFMVCMVLIFISGITMFQTEFDFAKGMMTGFFISIMVGLMYYISRLNDALKNEEKLKEMYIAETDERNLAIAKETSSTATPIIMMGLALSALVAGFINTIICITLVGALAFCSVVIVLSTAYYKSRM
ncbi:MAG: hypothetical protein E7500_00730 [Ruminococcus sp.]|nr:hypothetical protein [Ruminococcus sp.]